jgi:hypothetical protein
MAQVLKVPDVSAKLVATEEALQGSLQQDPSSNEIRRNRRRNHCAITSATTVVNAYAGHSSTQRSTQE